MKKINLFALIIFLFLLSCGNAGKILRNEKINTTDEFLVHFDLENTKELPGLDELKSTGLLDSNLPPDMYPIDDDLEPIEENN